MTITNIHAYAPEYSSCRPDNDESLSKFIGKVVKEIHLFKGQSGIRFICTDGSSFLIHHYQDCCENVTIEDIVGDLESLTKAPIMVAEERTNRTDPPSSSDEYLESYTWTFYEFRTIHGSVTIRWYGSSNGYYSEEVTFVQEH